MDFFLRIWICSLLILSYIDYPIVLRGVTSQDENADQDETEEFTYSQENLSKLLPSLRIYPKFKEPADGETVNLVCTTKDLDSDPDPDLIEWSFEPLEDRSDLKRKLIKAAPSLPENVTRLGNILIIWSMSKEHCGIYKCTVRLQDFNLTVQASAQLAPRLSAEVGPQVFVSPELIRLSLNSTASILCETTGYPPPKIVWYRLEGGEHPVRVIGSEQDRIDHSNDVSPSMSIDGISIENVAYEDAFFFCDERIPPCKSQEGVTGVSILHVEQSQAEHQGHYICRASNPLGSSQSTGIIDVEFGEPPHVRIPDDQKDQTIELYNASSKVTVTYGCTIETGRPTPKIRWLRSSNDYNQRSLDGVNVFDLTKVSSATSNVSTWTSDDGKTFYMSISTSSLHDQGEYVCLAENEWGKHSALARLHIRKPVSIHISQASPYVTRVNDSFQFECIASGYPLPLDIEWSRHDKGAFFSLISRQQGNMDESQEKAVLKFDRVGVEESGEYTCNARDPFDPSIVLRDTIMLLVEDASRPDNKGRFPSTNSLLPRLMVRPTLSLVSEGSNVTLDCLAVSGLQPTIVEWIAPPSLMTADLSSLALNATEDITIASPRIRPYYRTGKFSFGNTRLYQFGSKLKVLNVSKSHEGVYQCKGYNKIGVEISPALIKVADAQDELRGTALVSNDMLDNEHKSDSNRTKIAKAGSNIELKCQVDGVNQPVTSWSRDGMELPKTSVQIERNLWIRNVSQVDNGLYICSARSKVPNKVIQAKINLLVHGDPSSIGASDLVAKIVASRSNIHPGDSITLECIISKQNSSFMIESRSPKLMEELAEIERNVVWTNLHSGQSVFQDNVYVQGNLLIIYELKPENSATYRCNFDDLRQHSDYKLNVPNGELPSINNQLDRLSTNSGFTSQVIQVSIGGQLTLECNSTEVASDYRWMRAHDFQLLTVGDQNSHLFLDDMSSDMAGWYYCKSGQSSGAEEKVLRSVLIEVVVPVARFTQKPVSFISLPTISGADHQLNLEMKFLPERPHGLILFNGQQQLEAHPAIQGSDIARPVSGGDYILLGLNRGYLEFRFELGDGVTLLRSHQSLNMNQWHRLVIERNRQGAIMWVDQQAPVRNSSAGKFFNLNLDSVLYVGGSQFFLNRANGNKSSSRFFGYTRGFQGCIAQMRISRNEINMMARNRIVSVGIYECDKPECPRDYCNSHGLCQVDRTFKAYKPMNTSQFSSPSSDLRCICVPGFKGDSCEEESDPSVIGSNLHNSQHPFKTHLNEGACERLKQCSANGTLDCESSMQTSFKCHCKIGFVGKTCSQTTTFTDERNVMFTKQSYVRLRFSTADESLAYIHGQPLRDSRIITESTGSSTGSDGENLASFNVTNLIQRSSMAEQQNITFHVNTESSHGLLFYVGQTDFNDSNSLGSFSNLDQAAISRSSRVTRTKSVVANLLSRLSSGSNSDYSALALVEGYVEFSYELGSGLAIIRSSERVNNGQWHKIQIIRNGINCQLIIDENHIYKGSSPGKLSVLNTQTSDFFVGGLPHPYDFTTSSNLYLTGFVGCIMNLHVNSFGPLNMIRSDHITQLRSARNLEPCKQASELNPVVVVKPTQRYKPYTSPKQENDDQDEM